MRGGIQVSSSSGHEVSGRTYMSPFGRFAPTWKCGAYGRYCASPGIEVMSFDERLHIRALGRSRSQPTMKQTSASLESATGLKLQMLQMVQDLSMMQRRSLSARRHLHATRGSESLKLDELTEEVGLEIQMARDEINETFALLQSETNEMQANLDELSRQHKDIKGIVDRMEEKVCAVEEIIGHL
eukprot:GEMP01097570.1.p1 GENE.GEMP01097570.1~~GEMP01097570.1.p1  ORF type:complete len:185 (+),score=30.28 GEMP01097570.1:71-625(+)